MIGPDFISQYRTAVAALLESADTLLNLRRQYDALDLGNTLTFDDFAVGNSDITLQQLIDAVGSVGALTELLSQGHNTNLYRVEK